MNKFCIFTDSACDISSDVLKEWNVTCVSLNFRFVGNDTLYSDNDMTSSEFYAQMRAGKIAKTSAVNSELFSKSFETALADGFDVLYVGFSSGLSNTFNAGRIAAEGLKEKYPDRKIIAIDTLCASAGEGMMLRLACDKRDEGVTIEEAAAYLEGIKLRLAHWFTVDDLEYLKRGGRVSPAVAFVGNMLGIKPVLHVDNDGHLIKRDTVRGRKKAIAALADKMAELDADIEHYPIYISHADCQADADYLCKLIMDKFGKEVAIVTNVGTVIGAHSGPGTLALFFVAKER